jgi:hypothetical protein
MGRELRRHTQTPSLYSLLSRYLEHRTDPNPPAAKFAFSAIDIGLLRHKGFDAIHVEDWASCLLEPKSLTAARLFEPGAAMPPLFLLLLFLRRKHMSTFALGVLLRHVDIRIKTDSLTWNGLKILSVRLLRHARRLWPESIPWIASLFATEAAQHLSGPEASADLSTKLVSDVTRFSNAFLLFLSLPASIHPLHAAHHQEKAQFHVLQFMASCTPAITVTKLGFQSVTRNQLAHVKTAQEREWAELKGPAWPPWKGSRTAMDEDKGYEFGASRASKILHRMYEAGYRGHVWEEMAEIYAGWDSDLSPTIQTRTSLPRFSSQYQDKKYLRSLVWAARIRTTRTRREAWACFLAYELSSVPTSQEVYFSMFEQLYYPEAKRSAYLKSQLDLSEVMKSDLECENSGTDLLPGDMKEVLPDSTSTLHYVYLSEPIPTIRELHRRMYSRGLRPSGRLLAFLLEAAPTFDTVFDLLEQAREDFGGGVGHLLDGQHHNDSSVETVPDYLLAAFVKVLCRFGRFMHFPSKSSKFLSPERHAQLFKTDRHYLLEYAQALLAHYRPLYRPVWTTYLEKVVGSNVDAALYKKSERGASGRGTTQYKIVWKLLEAMEQTDIDIDDELFSLACTVTTYAAQAVNRGGTSSEDARHVLSTGSPRLRRLFHDLVGANVDMQNSSPTLDKDNGNAIPPHIPGPAQLHAYVRALGTLRDYEGLYSFSTWLTRHHIPVTARSEAQHSGSKLLFRTLVALRAAVTESLEEQKETGYRVPDEIVQLIKTQIEDVEEWGGWPGQEWVDLYVKRGLKTGMPVVGGR